MDTSDQMVHVHLFCTASILTTSKYSATGLQWLWAMSALVVAGRQQRIDLGHLRSDILTDAAATTITTNLKVPSGLQKLLPERVLVVPQGFL